MQRQLRKPVMTNKIPNQNSLPPENVAILPRNICIIQSKFCGTYLCNSNSVGSSATVLICCILKKYSF